MSFSDLVAGGAGCGPSNPLQNLGKRFGHDRSSQLDRFDGVSNGGAAESSQSVSGIDVACRSSWADTPLSFSKGILQNRGTISIAVCRPGLLPPAPAGACL